MPSGRVATPSKRHRYSRRRRFVIAALMSTGCDRLVDPPLPAGAVRYEPPAVYATWWQMVEACSGAQGNLAAITWYVVPNAWSIPLAGKENIGGYWSKATNEIVLAGQSSLDGGSVRHEMLHALLNEPGHPRAAFLAACGGTVECDVNCISDAGPPPPPDSSAVTVTPDELGISVSVAPAAPSASVNDGFFTVTVLASNATGRPVVVALPGRSATDVGWSFTYHLQSSAGGVSGGEGALDPAILSFAIGETKRYVFDFRIQSPTWGGLTPATYSVGGAFGAHWAYDTTALNP